MHAVQLTATKSPLVDAELPLPVPEADEVIVSIEAAGICRSDLHYRSGFPTAGPLPLTLGHEMAGTIHEVGEDVELLAIGQRVAVHYLVTCGVCGQCRVGGEQFCEVGEMFGKDRNGGYGEFVVVPERNAFRIPDEVPTDHAAVMMCSTATSYHALRKGRLVEGETVAVLGVGGLGMAAVQLGPILGAANVIAVDLDPAKLAAATELGAVAVEAGPGLAQRLAAAVADPIDVVLDLVGSVELLRTGLEVTAPQGRVVAVGLTDQRLGIDSYRDLIVGERTLVGSADHLGSEIPELMALAADGTIDLDRVVANHVPLDATAINEVLDDMERFDSPVRTVIVP